MRRRTKRTDPAAAAFGRLAQALDRAQRDLLAAVPTARSDGIPLAEALLAFERGLAAVRDLMPSWRTQGTEVLNDRCAAALEAAAQEAERLRLDEPPAGFEALNARIGDVLAPLEEFVEAERALVRGRE